jgi:hypothetical protein
MLSSLKYKSHVHSNHSIFTHNKYNSKLLVRNSELTLYVVSNPSAGNLLQSTLELKSRLNAYM